MDKYYIVTDNQQKGPYSIEELQELNISLSTLVWNEGMENWVEAKNVPELRNVIKISPPPIPKISDVTYKVEAEIKQNKEKLIKPETEIVVAKEIKIASRLVLYSLIAIVLAFPILLQLEGGFRSLQLYIKQDCEKTMQKLEENTRTGWKDDGTFGNWFIEHRERSKNSLYGSYFYDERIEHIIEQRSEGLSFEGSDRYYDYVVIMEYIVEEYMRKDSNALISEYLKEKREECENITVRLKDDFENHSFNALMKSLIAAPITAVLLIIGRYAFKGVKWVDKTSKKAS